jgi:hypothetical protein
LNFLQVRCFRAVRSGAIPEPRGVEDVADCTSSETQAPPFSWIWLALPMLLFIFMPSNIQAIADFVAAPDLPAFSRDIAERFPGHNALRTNEAQIVGFQSITRDRTDMLGQHSRIWQLRNESSRMTVSLDFPFRGWHPLWVCYMNAGWKQRSLEIVNVSDEDGLGREFAFYEALLENDLGDIAVLHFSLFDERGQPYTSERTSEVAQAENRLHRNLWTRMRREEQVRDPITFQFQQLSQTNTSPTPQQLERLRGLYRKLRIQVYVESMPVIESLTQR